MGEENRPNGAKPGEEVEEAKIAEILEAVRRKAQERRKRLLIANGLTLLGIALFVCIVLLPQMYLRAAAAFAYILVSLLIGTYDD